MGLILLLSFSTRMIGIVVVVDCSLTHRAFSRSLIIFIILPRFYRTVDFKLF
jgi:hypothetical protein